MTASQGPGSQAQNDYKQRGGGSEAGRDHILLQIIAPLSSHIIWPPAEDRLGFECTHACVGVCSASACVHIHGLAHMHTVQPPPRADVAASPQLLHLQASL